MENKAKSLKVLCIDDEPELLESYAIAIERIGLSALKAPDVKTALEIIANDHETIALVLSDYAMPDKNGFDLRNAMLAEHKQIPFVLISGNISKEFALNAIELKISAFIEKPFSETHLIETITKESKDRIAAIKEDTEILEGFVNEADLLTEEMESLILKLEEDTSNAEALNRIFACAHTIKGTSAFFKPDFVHKFTHKYEDYLSKYKKNPQSISATTVSTLLKGLDTIKKLVTDLRTHSKASVDLESLLLVFQHSIEVDSVPPNTSHKAPEKQSEPKSAQSPKNDEIRVNVELLDQFMEKSGELTVLRNMVNKTILMIESDLKTESGIGTLSELLSEMHKVNSFIQDQVVDLRKVSLKQIFKPLGRTLRDLCIGLKKQITFEVVGDDLRVDHTISVVLAKCLIHLLRNSADHGIEGPDERRAKGKSPSGKLTITAQETAEDVIIKLEDDGRGIDAERVKAKAVEKGIVSTEAANKMSDDELRMLIFAPGFSTAETVTDVSGRGVGTDMVKTTVAAAGGSIRLNSKVNEFTQFIINLPIPKSVLIVSSLLVRVSDSTFSIPQDCIARVVNLAVNNENDNLRNIGNSLFFQDRGKLLPVSKLSTILHLQDQLKTANLVCIQSKAGTYGLLVDEVLDIEDTVVKQSGNWLKEISVFKGATFLADGRTGLILDADGIGALLARSAENAASNLQTLPKKTETLRSTEDTILLFEVDSKCVYALKQSDIFRLEEFNSSDIQFTGKQPLVIYRDQTMPLVKVETLLRSVEPIATKSTFESRIPTIVIKTAKGYAGLVVQNIRDFADLPVKSSSSHTPFSNDTHIIKNQTVTLLNKDTLLKRFQKAA